MTISGREGEQLIPVPLHPLRPEAAEEAVPAVVVRGGGLGAVCRQHLRGRLLPLGLRRAVRQREGDQVADSSPLLDLLLYSFHAAHQGV